MGYAGYVILKHETTRNAQYLWNTYGSHSQNARTLTLSYQVRVLFNEAGYLKSGLKYRRLYRIFIRSGVEICQK